MGRKKVPNDKRRQVLTCSLKPTTLEKMNEVISYSTNRSKWIESAILLKIQGIQEERVENMSQRRLLAIIYGRLNAAENDINPLWKINQDNDDILSLIEHKLELV